MAAQLFPCTMEATSIIESIGLKVRVLASDGATPNRKFFGMLTVKEEYNIYWTTNPHDEVGEFISCQMCLTSWNLKELFGKLSLEQEYKKYACRCCF